MTFEQFVINYSQDDFHSSNLYKFTLIHIHRFYKEENHMSLIGKEIGDFSAQAFQNNSFKTVNREDLRGKWSVFFFYPADFTFVCPTELEDLENNYAAFQKAGCEIYSVSCDTHFVHKAWHDHSEKISKITYPMLADPTQALARDFEVLIPEAGLAERGPHCPR